MCAKETVAWALLSLSVACPTVALSQAFSDCREIGGTYGNCQEPSLGPWIAYRIWGATALPYQSCNGPFVREKDAIDCAKDAIVAANVGSAWPKWCGATFQATNEPWGIYASYYGWTTHERHMPVTFTYQGREYPTGACSGTNSGYIWIVRERLVRCPVTHTHWITRPDNKSICYQLARGPETDQCTRPTVGNPVRVSDRSKRMVEIDYQSPVNPLLRFERRYRSDRYRDLSFVTKGFGGAWKTTFERSIKVLTHGSTTRAVHTDVDDTKQAFIPSGSAVWTPAAEVTGRLRQLTDQGGATTGWVYSSGTEVEQFDAFGRLVALATSSGQTVQIAYWPDGDIAIVSDPFGRALAFDKTHDEDGGKYGGRLLDPAGREIRYLLDTTRIEEAPGPPRIYNLASITYQDGAKRLYHNGDRIDIPDGTPPNSTWVYNVLTGITDEVGTRFSEYSYDVSGFVKSTRHAGGVEQYSFGRASYGDGTAVTDPLGTRREYHFYGDRLQSVSQPAGAGSQACASAIAYDTATGLPSEFQQFNKNLTCFQYDATRRLPVRRLEGPNGIAGYGYCSPSFFNNPPAGARLISTQWHPDWRLETKVAEPKKITTIVYNGQGATCAPNIVLPDGKPPAVVCSRTEQATSDETGTAGFGATTTGTARTWSWTYGTYGRVLTETDPNGKTTQFSYYPDDDGDRGRRGNVATITNAVGHVTRFTAYDLHGQPTQIVDPNGLVIGLTYDLRMRITSRRVGNEVTSFGYDLRGLLVNVTHPDGASLTYTYDDAHRLIGIHDQQGNRVTYTLDAIGNRLTEQVKDPTGTLVRNIQRSIDALNRVQQIVGIQ